MCFHMMAPSLLSISESACLPGRSTEVRLFETFCTRVQVFQVTSNIYFLTIWSDVLLSVSIRGSVTNLLGIVPRLIKESKLSVDMLTRNMYS